MDILGQCSCGNLEHRLQIPEHLQHMPSSVCRCSFCRMQRPIWVGAPALHYHLRAENPAAVSQYFLGHNSADYVLCAHCGVVMCALTRIDNAWWAMINSIALVLPPQLNLDEELWQPHSETIAERDQRRRLTWVANVSFSTQLAAKLCLRSGGYGAQSSLVSGTTAAHR